MTSQPAHMKGAWLGLREAWRQLRPHWVKHWIVNIALGLFIELCLVVLHASPILTGARNLALDEAMRLQAAWPGGAQSAGPAITYIDVDEETFRDPAWGGGRPYAAPRLAVARLVQYAVAQGADYVVLDIALESPGTPEDAAFTETMAALSHGPVQILFMRQALSPLYTVSGNEEPALMAALPSSPWDGLLATAPNLHPVETYFHMSRDGVVRDWRLWKAVCASSGADPVARGHTQILPSPQLVIALRASQAVKSGRMKWSDVEHALNPGRPCAGDLSGLAPGEALASESTSDRVFATWLSESEILPHFEEEAALSSEGGAGSRIFYRFDGADRTGAVTTIAARDVLAPTDGNHALAKQGRRIKGGIVIIGQSFSDSGDRHSTPLGNLPGSLIIANAIASVLTPGVIQEPPLIFELGFGASLIVLVGYIFARLNSIGANAIAVAIVLPLTVVLSGIMLQSGYWFDFAVPLVGLSIHRAIAEIEEYVHDRRRAGANSGD